MNTCYLRYANTPNIAESVLSMNITQPVDVYRNEIRICISSEPAQHSQLLACDDFIRYNLASLVQLAQQTHDQSCTLVFTQSDDTFEIPKQLSNLINNIGFSLDIRLNKTDYSRYLNTIVA